MNIIELLKDNKGHAAAYVVLILSGVAGYTDLLIEHGRLQASVEYQQQAIDLLSDQLQECHN